MAEITRKKKTDSSLVSRAPRTIRELKDSEPEFFEQYCVVRDEDPASLPSTIAARLSAITGVKPSLLEDMAAQFDWERRYLEIKQFQTQQAISYSTATQSLRHLKLVWAGLEKAQDGLEKQPISSFEEARRAARTFVELERLLTGGAQRRIEVNTKDLDRRLAWLMEMVPPEEIIEGEVRELEDEDLTES